MIDLMVGVLNFLEENNPYSRLIKWTAISFSGSSQVSHGKSQENPKKPEQNS